MVGQRALGVARVSATGSRRILITGLSTYWGGRLAQALEQDPEVEAIIGIDRARRRSSWSARSSCGSPTSTRSSAASSRRPRSTRSSTRAWSSTRS